MTELAKFIFEQTGSLILNKKQTSKLIGKSIAYIDSAIHKNRREIIPIFSKGRGTKGTITFSVQDVADFVENMNRQVA